MKFHFSCAVISGPWGMRLCLDKVRDSQSSVANRNLKSFYVSPRPPGTHVIKSETANARQVFQGTAVRTTNALQPGNRCHSSITTSHVLFHMQHPDATRYVLTICISFPYLSSSPSAWHLWHKQLSLGQKELDGNLAIGLHWRWFYIIQKALGLKMQKSSSFFLPLWLARVQRPHKASAKILWTDSRLQSNCK